MLAALQLCFLKVVPVLFPFLVLNELIVNSPIPEYAGKSFGGIFSKVFKTICHVLENKLKHRSVIRKKE